MNVVNLKGEARNDFGKQSSKSLRKEGHVPCVIYGGEDVVHFSVKSADVKGLVYTPDFNIVEVEVDGKSYKTILKSIQFHPVTEIIEHMDFQELVDGRKVKVSIPVTLVGDSEGVREGGNLVTIMRKLEVKTTPEHLISELQGDISELNLNQSLSVRDMIVPEGIEVLHDPGSPVASVEVPRSLKSAESAAEAELEGAEGEEGAEGAEGTEGAEGGDTSGGEE